MTDSNTDVAQILRDVAAASDAVSGKIIRRANKAARKGKSRILVELSQEDYFGWLQSRPAEYPLTAPIKRLLDLGFTISSVDYQERSLWLGEHQVWVRW